MKIGAAGALACFCLLVTSASAFQTNNDITFATSGQSLWGPGAERPGPAKVNILNQGWNEGGSAGSKRHVGGFGDFGGSISASTNGTIRTSFGTRDFGTGAVGVTYPTRVSIFHPDPDNFRPGDLVRISASHVLLPGANITTSAPTTGSLTLSAQFGMAANVGAEACVFSCSSFPLLNLNFRPPELPVARIPMASISGASVGPASLLIENNGPGNCDADQIAIPPTSGLAQKTGVSGCFGAPSFATATSVGPGQSLLATGADQFMFISLDLDNWVSKIPGAPRFGVAKNFRAGQVSADALDVDLDHRFTLSHVLRFNPNILITLNFPTLISYIKSGLGEPVHGLGTSVTFAVGEVVDIIAPEAVIDMVPTFTMNNSFENNTELTIDQTIEERIMQAQFGLGGINLVCSPRICSPWGCCCDSCLSSPSVNFGLGPLFSLTVPTKVFRDSSLLDRQRPPWLMQGFAQTTRAPLNLNPNFFPIPVLEGPTVPVDEGSIAAFSAAMSTDPDGDFLTYAYDFGDSGTGIGPTTGETVDHRYGDNGTYTTTVFASDGFRDPVPTSVEVTILNVGPILSSFPSPVNNEGDLVGVSIDLLDPGFLDTFAATFDWGDGSPPQLTSFPAASTEITDQHTYADNGVYTVDFCVEDDDGAQDCGSLQTTISNVAPTITVSNFETTFDVINLGESLDVTCRFVAPFADQGTLDTHTARIDWGDSMSDPATVIEMPSGPPGLTSGALGVVSDSLTHNYDTRGTYPVQVCVEDDDGAETCARKDNLVVPEADLEVVSVVDPTPPGPVGAGTNIRYTYTITNKGPDSVDMVELVDTLPRHLGGLAVELLSAKRGGNGNSELKIPPANPMLGEVRYGIGLDVVGDTMAVGTAGIDEESAYVFARSGEDWIQEKHLVPGGFDKFGGGVALSSDEQTLAVTAESTPLHVFTRDGGAWTALTVNITSSALQVAHRKIDMADDTVVLSGRDENSNAGVVLVVERDDATTPNDPLDDTWDEASVLTETPSTSDQKFGQFVAISGDTIAVTSGGFIGNGVAGKVTIFVRNGGGWLEQATLTAADVTLPTGTLLPSLSFAQVGVSLDGDRLAIASGEVGFDLGEAPGSVAIFERTAGTWAQAAFLVPQGGIFALIGLGELATQDIELNGDSLVVGGYLFDASIPLAQSPKVLHEDVPGAAFLFLREDGIWRQESALTPSVGTLSDFLGAGVDVAGEVVYAGAPLFDDFGPGGSLGDLGGVFEFKICEHRPPGTVTCGLGTLGSGESAGVEILARVGCVLNTDPFVSVELTNTAMVDGNAIDPILGNNTAVDVHDTSVAPQGVCGQDLTPPSVTPIITGTLGEAGWYVSDVIVDWDVFDPDSPITSTVGCTQSTVTSDTAGVTFTCTATHTAANMQMLTTTESVTIKRDTAAPTIAATKTGTLGDNGWHTSDVSISFSCTDSLSGITGCTGPTVISQEGISTAVIGVATDEAGNQATTTASAKIDKTPPTIIGTRTAANANGWNNSDVTVSFACGDAVSGIASCSPQQVLSAEGAGQSRTGTARNQAGLEATATVANINIDKTPPSIASASMPAPNAAGWNNTAVDISFVCDDALSGVQSCPATVVRNTEGAGQVTNGTTTDLAGNQASTATTTSIDATPPTVSATASPPAGGNGVTEPPVSVAFVCNDSLSGIDLCPGVSILPAAGFGITEEGTALDKAGNSAQARVVLNIGNPEILPTNGQSAAEGESVGGVLATVTAAASTDGAVNVDWGDGTSEQGSLNSTASLSATGAPTTVSAQHVFADNGTYTVSVSATSLAGGMVSGNFDVTVSNAAPTIESISFPTVGDSTAPLALVVTFADAGSADTHTATVRWGDGSSESLVVTENVFGPPGATGGALGFAEGEHAYEREGSYIGEVCVTDDDGGSVCQTFSTNIGLATASRLACGIEVIEIINEDGPVTEIDVRARVAGTANPLSFQWIATVPGIEFDDPSSSTPRIRFDETFDRSDAFLVGVNIASSNPDGSPISCQSACGRPGPIGPLLGQCFTDAELAISPAPALSHFAMALALAGLAFVALVRLRGQNPGQNPWGRQGP